jgi:hypothetical protein
VDRLVPDPGSETAATAARGLERPISRLAELGDVFPNALPTRKIAA